MHRRWTQGDITDLRQRLSLGEAKTEIAAAIGRPITNVMAMMARLRLRETGVAQHALKPVLGLGI